MANEKLELGDRVRDTITGFTGVYIAHTRWLTGCDRITIESEKPKAGEDSKLISFDFTRIELVKKSVVKLTKPAPGEPAVRTNGGPRPEPLRSRDPR